MMTASAMLQHTDFPCTPLSFSPCQPTIFPNPHPLQQAPRARGTNKIPIRHDFIGEPSRAPEAPHARESEAYPVARAMAAVAVRRETFQPPTPSPL